LQQRALLQPLQMVLLLPRAPLYIKLAALAVMPKQTLISHVTRLKSQTTRHKSHVTRHLQQWPAARADACGNCNATRDRHRVMTAAAAAAA
jgi:hypothetical protein